MDWDKDILHKADRVAKMKNKNCIYLIRHSKTKFNNDDNQDAGSIERIRGWIDLELTREGLEIAKNDAKQFEDIDIDKIISSDLTRAIQTAKAIADVVLCDITLTRDFRPWNLGDLQGKVVTEVLDELSDYANRPDDEVPGGESFNIFKDRCLTAFAKVMNKFEKKNKSIIIVTHYRNIKLFDAWKNKGTDEFDIDTERFSDKDKGIDPGVGRIMTISKNNKNEWMLEMEGGEQ